MLRSRLLWRMVAGVAVLTILSAVLLVMLLERQVHTRMVEQARDELRDRARLLSAIAAPALRDGSMRALQDRLTELGRDTGDRYRLIGPDGRVLADSRETPVPLEDLSGQAAVVEALSGVLGEADTRGRSGRHLAFTLRLGPRSEPVGLVQVSRELPAAAGGLSGSGRLLLTAVMVVLPLAVLLAVWLVRQVVAPVRALADTSEALAAGRRPPPAEVRTGDELQRIGDALNRIGASSSAQLDAIRTERNRVLAILSGMVEGVVAIDKAERVVHLNEAAARILRAAPSSVGKRVWEITRVREVSEALSEALKEQKVVNREARIVLGQVDQVVALHAAPLHEGEARPGGAVVVLHDITDLRRLEDVRREFVANVSHELKTPLTAIGALVETLIDDRSMDEATHDRFLGKIRNQAARLSAMVRDLLSLSRIESREPQPDLQPVDVRRAVSNTLSLMAPNAQEKHLQVRLETPDTPLVVLAEEESLHHIVSNLLENAIKYTPEGGDILVRVRPADGQAVIEVEDSGIGIPASHHERIFERFYRVDRGRSRDVGGTGLGLSIVKHIALAHGGRIWVESEPGRGSTFRVALPLARESV